MTAVAAGCGPGGGTPGGTPGTAATPVAGGTAADPAEPAPECSAGNAAGHSYTLCVPEGGDPVPLIVALHGRGSSAADMQATTVLDEVAVPRGFAVLYPDAVGGGWGDDTFPTPEKPRGDEDVTALTTMVSAARSSGRVDTGPAVAVGFSNGASMAMRLGAARPDLVAAVVAVAGQLPADPAIRPSGRVPLLLVYGDADPVRPYATGIPPTDNRTPTGPTPTLSVPATIDAWLAAAVGPVVTTAPTSTDTKPDDGTSRSTQRWTDDVGPFVTLETILGGGHTWPSARTAPPPDFGRVSTEVDASAVAVDFVAEALRAAAEWDGPTSSTPGSLGPVPHDDSTDVGGDSAPHERENGGPQPGG